MRKRYRRIFSSRKDYEQTMFLLKFLALPALLIVGFFLSVKYFNPL